MNSSAKQRVRVYLFVTLLLLASLVGFGETSFSPVFLPFVMQGIQKAEEEGRQQEQLGQSLLFQMRGIVRRRYVWTLFLARKKKEWLIPRFYQSDYITGLEEQRF